MEFFLTFIVIVILFFWIMARFGPYLLAWWIKRKFGNINQNQFNGNMQDHFGNRENGDGIVNKGKSRKKMVDKSIGEYIDYEETK